MRWGAVVITETTVCPLPVTVAGLNVQLLSAGNPEHAKLTAPKPVEAKTFKGMLPDSPAAVIVTRGAPARVVKNPGWMVNVTD